MNNETLQTAPSEGTTMTTYQADRLRIEVVIDGETRIIDICARGNEKVRIALGEITHSADESSDGVERVSVNLSALGPVPQ